MTCINTTVLFHFFFCFKEWKSLLENKGDKGVALKVASLPRNDSSSSSLCEKDQGKIYNQSTSGLNNKPNGATKRLLGDEVILS